jgi:uncharacterized protein YdeI (YjbR/CyaY-like superfamily)
METKNNIPAFHAKNRADWRNWLLLNASKEKSVWLIIYHKKSSTPSIYYPEAIEEALCFGWIDSKSIKRDEESSYLSFTSRKPKGKWSSVNKERVERLIASGLMMPAGQAMIDLAKETGAWDALVDAENEVIPPDMQELFNENEKSHQHFLAFPPSAKRQILQWISDAKKEETRMQRIIKTVEMAAANQRSKV